MAQIILGPNRAYPSLPAVSGDVENHTIVLQAIREALEIHERRTKNIGDSFLRLHELEDLGLVNLSSSGVVVADDDDNLYIRRDGASAPTYGQILFGRDIRIANNYAINWLDPNGASVELALLTGGTGGFSGEVQHIVATAANFTNGTSTTLADVPDAVIDGADFNVGDEYIVFVFCTANVSSSLVGDNEMRLELDGSLLPGTTLTGKMSGLTDASTGEPFTTMSKFTYASGDLKLRYRVNTTAGSMKIGGVRMLAINLTELGEDNYVYDENNYGEGSPYFVQGTGTYDDIGPEITIGDGNDDWLIFMSASATNTSVRFRTAISVDDSTYVGINYRDGDVQGNVRLHQSATVHEGAASTTYKAVGLNLSGQASIPFTNLFAIKLNAFTQHYVESFDPSDPTGAHSEREYHEGTPFTVLADGNWGMFAGVRESWGVSAYSGGSEIQYEVDGGGLIDNALWNAELRSRFAYRSVTASDKLGYKVLLPEVDYAFGAGEEIGWSFQHAASPSGYDNVLTDAFYVAFSWEVYSPPILFVLGDPDYGTRIDGDGVTVSTSLVVDETLDVTGATTLGSTLDVVGAVDFDSTLNVTGDSTFANTDHDAITATSYGGILEENLLDKTASEVVSGAWSFTEDLQLDTQRLFLDGPYTANFGGQDFIIGARPAAAGKRLTFYDYQNSREGLVWDLDAQTFVFNGDVTADNLNVSDWDEAYSWGDHSLAGYAQKENVVTVTTTFHNAAVDTIILVDDDTAGSEVTVNLPAGSADDRVQVKKLGTTANVVIDGSGSETIDDDLTITLTTQYESVSLWSDGVNWYIL